jgi:hypothetical protein
MGIGMKIIESWPPELPSGKLKDLSFPEGVVFL